MAEGYADFHFIIPELVDQVQVNKGPTDINYGDLATAFQNMQHDISVRESRIMDLAYRDTLTNLPKK